MTRPDRSLNRGGDSGALELTALLRSVSGPVPDDEVDWNRFHRCLATRAELTLARRRHPRLTIAVTETRTMQVRPVRHRVPVARAWWEHTAHWSRRTVTTAFAAGLALGAVIQMTPKASSSDPRDNVASSDDAERTRAAFESAVVGRTMATSVDSVLIPTTTDLLVSLGGAGGSP